MFKRVCYLVLAILFAGLSFTIALPAADDPDAQRDKILKRFVEELVPIEPGKGKFPATFTMGSAEPDAPASEKPPIKVTLKDHFAIAKYEVTQELYEAIMGKNPSKWKGPRNSVETVSWEGANDFCQKLTNALHERKLLALDQLIRLPSEAEWEYCCRAGTTTRYSFGDKATDLGDYAWYKDNSKGENPTVGAKKPNPWGLYDMHGYVREWCADAWHKNHEDAAVDGRARPLKNGKERVLRGGSWAGSADTCRSAHRQGEALTERNDTIGFRCVRAAAPK